MRRRELLWVLGAGALAACAGRQPGRTHARGPMLWQAERGAGRVFILGVAEARDGSWWSAPIDRAFAGSGELWFETPPQPAPGSEEADRRKALIDQLGYQPGRTFYDALAPEVRTRARAYVAELEIDPAAIEPMRPWLAYYTINGAFWKKHPPAVDMQYADAALRERAGSAGKAVRHEFATSAAALHWFAGMPDAAQSQYIAMLLDFLDDQKAGLNDVYFGWTRGQPSTRAIDRMRSTTPALYDVIQRRRNVWWAETIDKLLSDGSSHLVVLGMNHVLGPDGVPHQIARRRIAHTEVGGER